MINKEKIYYGLAVLYLTVLFFSLAGCTEKIDLDLGEMDNMPVITGVVSNEEQWIRLSTTSAYQNDEGGAISNATVSISDGINIFPLYESTKEKGLYEVAANLLININPSLTYTLKVDADFDGSGAKQTYSAVSTVAPSPNLDLVILQVMRSFDDLFWFIQINYNDTPEPNSYLCRVFVNGMLDVGLSSYHVFDNRYTMNEYVEHKMVTVLYERPLSDDKIEAGDVVDVYFSGITKEYFDFLYGAMKETSGRNPLFSGPPANVKGNISNGALGMFTVYISSSMSVVIPDVEY